MTNAEMLAGQRSKVLGTIRHPALRTGRAKVTFRIVRKLGSCWDARIILRDSQGSQSLRFSGLEPYDPAFTTQRIIDWLDN